MNDVLTVPISPIVIEPMPDPLVDRGHSLHVTLSPVPS